MKSLICILFSCFLFSFSVKAEIVYPLPTINFNAAEFKIKPVAAKKAELQILFTQFTKEYNEQFKKDNNLDTAEVIAPAILSAKLDEFNKLNENELNQPIDVHIENIKATYDYVGKQMYDIEMAAKNNLQAETKPSSDHNFRYLEIAFAIMIIMLASLIYLKTYKNLNISENKKNGFSLVEVLVALGLLSIVGVGASTMIFNMMSSNNYVIMGNSALNLKAELTAILSDDRAWKNTITDVSTNPDATSAFACIRNSTNCTAGIYPFTPKLVNNALFRNTYNPQTIPGQGFNNNGVMCTTYSTTTPDDACPMRYTFTWQPLCPSVGPCVNPQVRIRLVFNFSATNKLTLLNPERYGNDNIIVGYQGSMYSESSCILMGGTWTSATRVCTPPALPPSTQVRVTCTRNNYTCSSVWVAPVVVAAVWNPPVLTCKTLSGGSSPTCGAFTGRCTCTAVVRAGYWTPGYTIPGYWTPGPCSASGSCSCPPSCPTAIGTSYTPATPVSPASYSAQTTCLCP